VVEIFDVVGELLMMRPITQNERILSENGRFPPTNPVLVLDLWPSQLTHDGDGFLSILGIDFDAFLICQQLDRLYLQYQSELHIGV
jgi:hypothetical protein